MHPDDADEARRIIESHRTELHNGQVVRLRDEFETLQRAIDYRFRDRGLLEHAMTHTSRANEDVSGGVVDNESLEFLGDAVLGFVDRRPAVPRVPGVRRGAEVEDQGGAGLDGDAGAAGRAAGARRPPAARARRGEDRRPPQAGAARRRLRGADRRDLSRRRHRAGARVHRPRVRAALDDVRGRRRWSAQDYKSALQEYLQSRDGRCPSTAWPARSGPIIASSSRWKSWSTGEALAEGDRAEQERSGAGSGAAGAAKLRSGLKQDRSRRSGATELQPTFEL